MTEKRKNIGNFPNLRFPGFEEDWKVKKLGEVCEIGRGKSKHRPRDAEFLFGGKYPFIQTGDVRRADLYLSEFTQTYSEAGLKQSKLWDENTLCITIAANIAETAILKIKACFPDSVIGLIPKENKTSVLFVKHLFDKFKIEIQKLSQGAAQDNLNQEKLSKIQFAFPSIVEQQKISSFLLLIDERISTQKKIIKKLETSMRSYRQKLFSRKIRFKDKNGNDFSDWENNKIKKILKIGSGKDYKHLNDGEIPVYGTGGIITFVNSFLYDGETVCIGRKGTINKPIYHYGKIWTVDTLFYTHSFNNSIPKFVFHVFQNINWKEYNEASGVPSLSKSTIENIQISIPCIAEQIKISDFLFSISDRIEIEKKILQKLEIQKKYLLANLFA